MRSSFCIASYMTTETCRDDICMKSRYDCKSDLQLRSLFVKLLSCSVPPIRQSYIILPLSSAPEVSPSVVTAPFRLSPVACLRSI